MSRPRLLCLVAALALVAGTARSASANGRFPQTMSCETRPGDDQFILIGATFGLLLSYDDGQTWSWVCEEALGYTGTFDPEYAVTADGTIYATTFDGLRKSSAESCVFDIIPGILEGHFLEDVELGADGAVWAITSSGGQENFVAKATDGVSFEVAGLSRADTWWKSIKVAPSDPNRVYVSGYVFSQTLPDAGPTDPAASLYRSDDGGVTWSSLPLDGIQMSTVPQVEVEAIDLADPDVVYLRAVSANPPLGDALYRSTDAGQTWQKILDTNDSVQVMRFTTTTEPPRLWVGTINDGVKYTIDGGTTWETPGYQTAMACLCQQEGDELFACGANWEPDFFALGRSTDDGESFAKIMRFAEIDQALTCEPGTIQYDTCESIMWPPLCESFGCNTPDGGPSDGGSADAGDGNGNDDTCLGCSANGSLAPLALVVLLLPLTMRRRRSACRPH